MKLRFFASICVTATTAAAVAAGCGGSNNPSTTSGSNDTGNPSSNGAVLSGGSSTGPSSNPASSNNTGGGGGATSNASTVGAASSQQGGMDDSGSASTSTAAPSSDGGDAVCASTLKDKMTTCTVGVDPDCAKGCGPDLPPGSSQSNLGNKTCTCMTGVYQCGDCNYLTPLPGCFQAAASPPACPAGTADKLPCTTPCVEPGTGNDVCTTLSDAGKSEGCVCIAGSNGNVWTCATLPW